MAQRDQAEETADPATPSGQDTQQTTSVNENEEPDTGAGKGVGLPPGSVGAGTETSQTPPG